MTVLDLGDYRVVGKHGAWRVQENFGSMYIRPQVFTRKADAIRRATAR